MLSVHKGFYCMSATFFVCFQAKSAANVPVKNGKNVEQDVDEEMSSGDDDFTDDSDDIEMSEDGSSDEEMSSATDLSGDSEDESEESEEEQTPTPKKVHTRLFPLSFNKTLSSIMFDNFYSFFVIL